MDENTIKEKLKTYIIKEIIKDEEYPLTNDEPLISGGLIDSFSLVNIAVFIENEFKVKIPDTELTVENLDTLDAMASRTMKELS